MSDKKKPIDVLRDGRSKASIWQNQGKKGDYYTVTLARTYKDEDGNLRDTKSLMQGDLLTQSELLKTAYHRVNELKRENFKNKRSQEPQEHQNDRTR